MDHFSKDMFIAAASSACSDLLLKELVDGGFQITDNCAWHTCYYIDDMQLYDRLLNESVIQIIAQQ